MTLVSIRSTLLQSTVTKPLVAAMETRPDWFYPIAFLVSLQMATVFSEFRQVGHVVLHALRIGLTRHNYSGPPRPSDEWGGLVVIASFLLGVLFVVRRLYGRLSRVRNANMMTGDGKN